MNNRLISRVNRSLSPEMKKAGYVSRLFSSDCFECRSLKGDRELSCSVVPSRSQVAITSGFPASRFGCVDCLTVNPLTLCTLEPPSSSSFEFCKTLFCQTAKLIQRGYWTANERGGTERLIIRSGTISARIIRYSVPPSNYYVVQGESIGGSRRIYSLLASLRKASLRFDRSLGYAARIKLSLFSKLAEFGQLDSHPASRLVSHRIGGAE